ncbi:unnamed protein product [Nippostrongylus brasiliensis]|uniref:Immunoglobulin I-set domain protein n=1 Tax=Nippostrongylus brasiliensis TaxID=27835 RepID=A0A158R1G2_NIPBR|nr:unnamed protein product [Nippostrongylus brasiliensis]
MEFLVHFLESPWISRCYAENELGSAWTEGPIVVTLIGAPVPDGEAPDFIQPVRPVMVNEGETAVLEGKVSGKPKPTVKWYKNGEEIKPSDHFVVESLDDGTQRLTVKSTTMDDLDEYRCSASNEFGDVWSDVTLTVKRKPQEAPSFTKTLVEVSVVEGESATYECKVTGTPEPEIKWFKVKDSGEIRCEATNPAGKARTDAPLTVTLPDEEVAPEFAQDLQACSVNEGELAKFECKVKGTHLAVKWFKDGQELKPGDGIQIESLPDGTNRLTIDKTKMADQGNYRVEATNPAGSMSSKAPLSIQAPETLKIKRPLEDVTVDKGTKILLSVEVEGQPKTIKWYKGSEQVTTTRTTKIEKVSDVVYKLEVENCEMTDAGAYRVVLSTESESVESSCTVTVKDTTAKVQLPSFKKGLNDQAVPKGQSLVLEVEIEGKPKVVKWYKNGDELKDVKAEDMGDGKYRLTIPDFKDSDVGEYSVTAENECGEVESKAKVTLQEPTDDGKTGKPEIVSGLVPTTVKCGETAVFTVKVKGPVKAVKWYKNGKEIPDAKTKDNGDGSYELLIPDAKKDDTADYKVILSNDAGDADSSAALTVKLPQIEIVKGLQDTTVPQKETGVLEIETNQKPKQVKWYKNGKEITPSDKPQAKQIDDNKYQLVIPDAGKDDTAEYKLFELISRILVYTNRYKNGKEITPSDKPEVKKVSDTKHQLVIPDVAGEDTADYKVVLIDDDGNEADSSCALTVKLPSGIEIVKGLEDATVPKGQQAVYKNGKELTPSDKPEAKKISDTKHQLVIPDVAGEDTADYKVVLIDDDGNEADSSCALTVKLPSGIEIVKGLEDATVPKGRKAVLEVETSRAPKQVKWYKNGKELTPSDKPEVKKISDTKHQLVVLTDDDDNSADSFCALTVRLPDKEPKIIKGLDDRTLAAGLPTIWEVETEGSPRTVKWYKNGKELTGATAAQMKISKIDDNHYVLEIPKCVVDDTGDYKIEVENDAGKANSTGKLTVEPQLTFLKPLKDQEITEGENAEFQVETNAKPRVVKWYKNGQEITPDSRFVVTEDETKFKLVIKNATRDDAADYKIVLSNTAGDADSSAKLTVKRAKPGVPKIIKGLEDQVVAKGASLVFEVKVEGEVDELRWSKDAAPITAGANAIIEKIDDKTYVFLIRAASDAKGEVDEKPEIVKGLNDLEVSEGDDEVFKVEVSVPVRTVKWYKNGQEIKPSVHLEPKKIGPKKYELIINRAELDDAATFKVVLSNAAGECDSSAQLTVTKPNILKMLEGLKDIDVDEGQPLELKVSSSLREIFINKMREISHDVKVEGIPKVVKWYKNGQELAPTDAELKENPETGEYSLLIPQSKKSDGGAYRVTLANDKGEIYSGAVAHVKTVKPKDTGIAANFLSPLEDTEVAEGETLTLKCVVAGEPFPSIVWTKDGVELEKDERVVTVKDKGEQPSKPRFIIPLKSCEAEIGENKMFEVKIRGFPKPTLQWLLNEKPIQFDERVTVEDMGAGNYCLTIKDVSESFLFPQPLVRDSDFGTLRCIATNDLGKDECQAEFDCSGPRAGREKDDDRYPPRFNVPLWDRRIPINDPLSIESSESIEIRNSSDGACRVRIAKFGKEDVGVYMCVAKNPLGVADTRSNYSVEVVEMEEVVEKKEYAPRFNPGLEDKSVNVGQSVRLTCTVDAIPKASIVWYKDGLPLRSGGRHNIIIAEDGTCTLDITETVEGDEGAYRCVASNEHGSINTSCMVTVKVPKAEAKKEGEEPFFTKGLVDVWTDRGETFTLKCCVKGDPFPEIKWFRNGILVRDTVRTTIETSTDGTCSLTVKECTMSDEGIYRCEAENKHGKAKTQATAHIQGESIRLRSVMSLGKGDVPKLEMGSAPKFVIPLEDQTVTVGSTIDLECKVTGEPMPQVKWSKDGGPIWEDSRYEWDIDEAKVTAGALVCLVTIFWYGKVREGRGRDRILLQGVYHLRITSATVNDEGTYRAVATNESGSATTKSFTRIDDGLLSAQLPQKSTPPRFTIKLGDARAVEGQPLRFECKVEGSPLPELTWHKDGAQIHPSDRVQISMEPDGTARLVIPQCCMDDEVYRILMTTRNSIGNSHLCFLPGIYRVIATNPSGSAHDKGNAVVKKAPRDFDRRSADRDQFDANKVPKVVEPLENVKVITVAAHVLKRQVRRQKAGTRPEEKFVEIFGFQIPEKQGFRLRCKFSGEPKLAIKWFKDGERVFPYGRLQLLESPDGVCELIVDSSIRQDAGGYRCVAENAFGSARTTCDVTVIQKERKPVTDFDATLKEGKAPGFTVPLTIRRAKPGDDVAFECVPYGNPFPQIKWLKDGIEITPSDKIRFESLPDGTQRLHLSSVDFFSEGYFRCVATNEHGDRNLGSKIVPEVASEPEESKPRIRRGLYNMSIHQGNTVEMIVCATGWPTPTVKWFKNGEEIVPEGPEGRLVTFTDDRGIHHLVLLNVGPEDEGDYSLEATNKLGMARTEGALSVIRPRQVEQYFPDDKGGMPFPPGFVRQLKNKHVFNRMPTIFDCLVVGYPAPEVEWLHNGKKIVPGGRIKIQSCGGGSHALILLDTTVDDAGEYVAVARNIHGTASSSAVLDVTVPYLDNIKFNGEVDVTPYLTEEYGFKKLNYASKSAVSYVIEIRELPEKEWTLLDYNIPEPVCKVRNLELGKSYQFRVRAENIYGISDPSPASPPSRLMAPPQPVLDKNKKVIPLLDPYAEKALDLAHAEQYACAPWFAPGVEEKRFCAENDTLSITLNVAGYPDPQIKWKFRGWDIDTTGPTSQCKVYTIGGTETTLLINAFTKDNVGQYQCFATNAYGEAQQNIMVDLAVRPSFIQPLFNRTFSDAQPMRLDVRVEGQPFPEVKWLKEWRPIVESTRVKFVQDGPYLCSLVISDPLWRDSADGDFNDVELPKKRAMVEARKIREIYEIAEEDET